MQIDTNLACLNDVAFSLDRVAEAEAVARNPELETALDFPVAREVKADVPGCELRDHRAGRIGLHCVVEAGLWQQGLKRHTALPHRLEVNNDAGRRVHVAGQVPIDPSDGDHCGTNGPVGRDR
jgi:hypothetical protein